MRPPLQDIRARSVSRLCPSIETPNSSVNSWDCEGSGEFCVRANRARLLLKC